MHFTEKLYFVCSTTFRFEKFIENHLSKFINVFAYFFMFACLYQRKCIFMKYVLHQKDVFLLLYNFCIARISGFHHWVWPKIGTPIPCDDSIGLLRIAPCHVSASMISCFQNFSLLCGFLLCIRLLICLQKVTLINFGWGSQNLSETKCFSQ